MAAKKNPIGEPMLDIEDNNEYEQAPDYSDVTLDDTMTVKIAEKQKSYSGPMVTVYLPKLEDEGNGVKVDQYVHVTIANEYREWTWYVKRGERVDVPVPVFVQLKNQFPDI